MTCREVQEQEITERYIAGSLPEGEREAFEAHYFECDECFAGVQAVGAVRERLVAQASEIRALTEERPATSRLRILVPLALAAAILLAAVLYRKQPSRETPANPSSVAKLREPVDFTVLAKVEPPAYRAALLRGADDAARQRFRAAMDFYVKKDYAAAVDGLNVSIALNGHLVETRFFLGASELLTGSWDEGTRELQRVADAGDSPFREESRMLLAEAALHRNDSVEARRELGLVSSGPGDFTAQARELLAQMDSLSASR